MKWLYLTLLFHFFKSMLKLLVSRIIKFNNKLCRAKRTFARLCLLMSCTQRFSKQEVPLWYDVISQNQCHQNQKLISQME